MMTLEEMERSAYIEGHLDVARVLRQAVDLESEVMTLDNELTEIQRQLDLMKEQIK